MELALSSIGIVTFIFVAARVFQWLNGTMVGRNAAYQATRQAAGSTDPGTNNFYVSPGIDLTPNDGRPPAGMSGGAGSPPLAAPDHACTIAQSWIDQAQIIRGDAQAMIDEGRFFMEQGQDKYEESADLISKGSFDYPESCDSANGANQLEACSQDLHKLADDKRTLADDKNAEADALAAGLEDCSTLRSEADAAFAEADAVCTVEGPTLRCILLVAVFFEKNDAAVTCETDRAALQARIDALRLEALVLYIEANNLDALGDAKHLEAEAKYWQSAVVANEGFSLVWEAVHEDFDSRAGKIRDMLIWAEALERNAGVYCGKAPWAR